MYVYLTGNGVANTVRKSLVQDMSDVRGTLSVAPVISQCAC